ncbi:hypothetical protein ACWEPL_64985, partial [Nonomuraea sp. NPDC004186]
ESSDEEWDQRYDGLSEHGIARMFAMAARLTGAATDQPGREPNEAGGTMGAEPADLSAVTSRPGNPQVSSFGRLLRADQGQDRGHRAAG